MSSKYEFIDSEKANYPIWRMCVWAQVSRSGFYEWRGRPASATTERRAALTVKITAIFTEFRETCGYRRVHHELVTHHGETAGAELVRSIMVGEDLVACQPRPWRNTTETDGSPGPADRLGGGLQCRGARCAVRGRHHLHRDLGGLVVSGHRHRSVREVVGWSMADHLRTTLVTDALDMAHRNGRVNADATFHSDRGRPVHLRRVRSLSQRPFHVRFDGTYRSLLGQRSGRKLLRFDEERARVPHCVSDASSRTQRDRRVHRNILQPEADPLSDRLPYPRATPHYLQ